MKRLQLTVVLFIVSVCLSQQSMAQCPYSVTSCDCGSILMPPDPEICGGTAYVHDFTPDVYIPPGFTVLSWDWTPSASVTPSTGPYPSTPGVAVFTPTTTTTYTLEVEAAGPNILNDGDFAPWSLGTPCFNTSYSYVPIVSGLFAPGRYSVLPFWPSVGFTFTDHSSTMPGPPPGPYNMLIANGQPGAPAWEETGIPVCSDEDYIFEFQLANMISSGPSIDAQIRVVIGGVTFGPYQVTGAMAWHTQAMIYHSPVGGGPISIQIYDDQRISYQANIFAIDDISFNRLCKFKNAFTINVDNITTSGPASVCAGSTIALTATPPGGTWSCGPGATIDAYGNLTAGIYAGGVMVNYASPLGCTESTIVTILPTPTITGTSGVCEYDIAYVTGSPSGLVWSHSGPIISPWAGMVGSYWGSAPGTATITYTDPTTGCYADYTVTVYETPTELPINYYRCVGDALTFTETPTGGTWTSSNPYVATIDPVTGVVTTINPGTTVFVYTTAAGCEAFTQLHLYDCSGGGVTVGGGGNLCAGSNTTLIGLPIGGTWTSSNSLVATIDPVTGYVYAVPSGAGGIVTFTYVSGSVTTTTTLNIEPWVSACVTTDPTSTGFNFTTSCSGPAYVYYVVYDFMGMPVGFPSGYSVLVSGGTTFVPLTYIESLPYGPYPSCSDGGRVCVTGVTCGDCYFAAHCCAGINMGHKSANGPAGNTTMESSLRIAPNPNNGSFTLTGMPDGMGNAAEARIEISDMLGRAVYHDVATLDNGVIQKNIQLGAEVTNGIYIIKVYDGNASQVMRFVLNR